MEYRPKVMRVKEKYCKERALPFDGKYYTWDTNYYGNKLVQENNEVDRNLVKEYFPVASVVPAVIKIYEDLLGVKFVEDKRANDLWHPGTLVLLPQTFCCEIDKKPLS